MKTTGRTSQPIGHYEYCRKYRADCNIRTSNSRPFKLTRARWNELVDVNMHSNTTIRPVTDQEYYHVEELWTYPKEYGDCEDYVLMKRHMLMQRGWPASSLLVTVVRQANGDGHAVLTVRTDKADYILDNLQNNIKPWNQTEYRYLKRQSIKNSGHWSKISDKRRI
ncbi:MAG: transglutaminase-like cysteine peptidase [Rhizobiaceae bacterium]|nr:transglutaminase-like cysteine peptidase [Rhizobiaceae bacterium]